MRPQILWGGKLFFYIHYSLVRKRRKEMRRDRKGTGDSFCICVQYGFFWFFILHSQELPMGSHLLPRLCHTCLPVWKWLSCRHWMRLTDHIYLSGVYWAHRAPRIKPWTRAQKQVCIEAANLLHRPRLIVWTPKVKTPLHSCFPCTVLCLCVCVCSCVCHRVNKEAVLDCTTLLFYFIFLRSNSQYQTHFKSNVLYRNR